MLKQAGPFPSELLGKRVDYSGRSSSCRAGTQDVPVRSAKEMALELFKPFVMNGSWMSAPPPNQKREKEG
jgi:DNA-directed RNA polymerase beta' subunit